MVSVPSIGKRIRMEDSPIPGKKRSEIPGIEVVDVEDEDLYGPSEVVQEYDHAYYKKKEFYADAIKIGKMSLKSFYDPQKMTWFVCWRKENCMGEGTKKCDHSHIQVAATDLSDLINRLRDLIMEMKKTHYRDEIRRLKYNKEIAALTDRNDIQFWDEKVTEKLDSGCLWFRPFRQPDQSLSLKFLSPRTLTTPLYNWNGVVITVPVGQAHELWRAFIKLQNQIDVQEAERLQALKGDDSD